MLEAFPRRWMKIEEFDIRCPSACSRPVAYEAVPYTVPCKYYFISFVRGIVVFVGVKKIRFIALLNPFTFLVNVCPFRFVPFFPFISPLYPCFRVLFRFYCVYIIKRISYFKCLTQQESPRSSILFLVREKKKKKRQASVLSCIVVVISTRNVCKINREIA